jgi:hypothetical protein
VGNKFVLNTVSMTSAQRTAAGLLNYDTSMGNSSSNFDHLPLVVDFRIFNFAASDFDFSRTVDAADFAIWQAYYGMASGATRALGDANGDGRVDGGDFLVWQQKFDDVAASFVVIPEPGCLILLGVAVIVLDGRAFCSGR